MPQTLLGLPQEIRNLIWDDLLSVEKNITIHPGPELTPTWSIQTSLFQLNKQLSHETISYFHHRNLFIHISQTQSTGPFSQDPSMGPLTDILPRKYVRGRIPPTVLKIKFTQGEYPPTMKVDTGVGAVMCAAYLPTLVRVFNAYHAPSLHPGWSILPTPVTEFVLDFGTDGKYYAENEHQTRKLINSLRGLGSWLLGWYDPPIPPTIEIQNLNPDIAIPLFNLLPLTSEEIFAEAKRIQEFAQKLVLRGNIIEAKMQYTLAYHMVIQNKWSNHYLRLHDEELVREFLRRMELLDMRERSEFLVNSWVGFSVVLGRLGDSERERDFVKLAFRFVEALKTWRGVVGRVGVDAEELMVRVGYQPY